MNGTTVLVHAGTLLTVGLSLEMKEEIKYTDVKVLPIIEPQAARGANDMHTAFTVYHRVEKL